MPARSRTRAKQDAQLHGTKSTISFKQSQKGQRLRSGGRSGQESALSAEDDFHSLPDLASIQHFQHDPLDLNTRSIRVISVIPSPDTADCQTDTVIECTIRQVPLAEDQYICLSYAWGDEASPAQIVLNGKLFMVWRNLYQFLLQARKHKLSDDLWIDAICLDQQNVQERNHQVQQMAEIYCQASSVIVWLGVDDGADAFCLLSLLPNREVIRSYVHHCVNSNGAHVDRTGAYCDQCGRSRGTGMESALAACCHLEYFNRLWVLQEICVAKELNVWWGATQLSEDIFSRLVSKVGVPEWLRLIRNSRPSFQSICQATSRQRCTRVHDRVYSLLGIINSGAGFDVDYDEQPLQLARRVLAYFGFGDNPKAFAQALFQGLDLGLNPVELFWPQSLDWPRRYVAKGPLNPPTFS